MKKSFYQKIIQIASLAITVFLFIPLTFTTTVQAAGTNIINNPSVETVSADLSKPLGWNADSWGQNIPSYEYRDSGSQDGTRSLYVNVSNYSNGDAKWYFDPVVVSPNTQYVFSDYYKSNINTDYVAWFISTSGQDSYLYLGSASSNTSTWTPASFAFTTPSNVAKVSVFHLVAANGDVWTDNYSLSTATAPVITGNVPNSSFEQTSDTNSGMPLGWNQSSWGQNNASFQYLTTGHTGSRSAKVTITSYTNGDAKWYFDMQPAKPGKTYTFTDYYKSSVVTEVVAVVEKTDNTIQYIDLPSAAVSSSWNQYTGTFAMPATAKNFTVFHLINKAGNLTVDDYSIDYSDTPINTGIIPNSSVEQVSSNSSLPLYWSHSSWGTNTVKFQYLNSGHTGSRSVKTTISSYTDGDAKWYFEPQLVTPGTQLRFTDFYISNITTQVVAMFEMNDGSYSYISLKGANKSSSWVQYSDVFEVPVNAVKVSILHLIAGVGSLTTDDYSLTPYAPVGFNRGLVSLTFDDGFMENYTNVLPRLNAYGYKSTQFYSTQILKDGNLDFMVKEFYNSGHEIGSHTVTHPDLRTLSRTQLDNELKQSKRDLEALTAPGQIKNFASPYGAYNDQVIARVKQYYQSHRSVDAGYNSKDNFDIYNVRVQNILNTTTSTEVQHWVEKAKQDKTWLVLVFHRVGTDPGAFDSSTSSFEAYLEVIKNANMPVVTYNQALTEVKAQL